MAPVEQVNTANNDLNQTKATPPPPVPTPRFKRKNSLTSEEKSKETGKGKPENSKMQNSNYKYHFNPAQNLSQDSGLSPRYFFYIFNLETNGKKVRLA